MAVLLNEDIPWVPLKKVKYIFLNEDDDDKNLISYLAQSIESGLLFQSPQILVFRPGQIGQLRLEAKTTWKHFWSGAYVNQILLFSCFLNHELEYLQIRNP